MNISFPATHVAGSEEPDCTGRVVVAPLLSTTLTALASDTDLVWAKERDVRITAKIMSFRVLPRLFP